MAFDIPRGKVMPVGSIDVRLEPARHPFEIENAAAIDANWLVEHAANPALFNGTMVLLSKLALHGERLTGICHPVNYATMLYWRKNRGDPGIEHSFAYPALVAADNALVAIRMGPHTANPGRVYFAAGSFEPGDFVDGQVDLHGNMMREVREETGLDIASVRHDDIFHVFSANNATAIFRRYYLDDDADTIARRIETFVANEAHPEIEGPVIIRSADERLEEVTGHMRAIVDWHFATA